MRGIPKVGGTKDVKVDRIRELAPTHVVVNVDENTKETVDELARFVPSIVVTHPLAPEDNLGLYRLLGGIFDRTAETERLCDDFAAAYADLTAVTRPAERVLYLIWREPWMTVSRDTYISRTLALVGWETVPEERARRAIPSSTRPPLPGVSSGCCSRASPIASARSISPRSRRSFPVPA